MKYKNKVYGKIKAKHPELDMVGITKKIKKRFEKLSEEDKVHLYCRFHQEASCH